METVTGSSNVNRKLATAAAGLSSASALLLTGSIPTQPAIAQTTAPEITEGRTVESISETKRALIFQLLEITGVRQQHEQIQQAMFAQMQPQMQATIGDIASGLGDQPPNAAAIAANLSAFMGPNMPSDTP
ncbi:MAG: hypothetical protein WBA10_16250 [Elainellaceae cyanobacterium]